MEHLFDIQFFADAGTLVNGTANYPNAYDSTAAESFSGSNTLSAEMKDFYDTELLENARVEQFYAQFAKRQPLPRNHKGTVEWRKWNTFAPASQLTEGVIPTGQKFGVSAITGTIAQYGTYTAITDRLELRAYDDVILGATEEMGASAAETQEKLIRDALLTNANVLYCDNIVLATGAKTADQAAVAAAGDNPAVPAVKGTPDAPSYMLDDGTNRCVLTPAMVNKAVTILKKNRVPRINGRYYAVIHPSVAHPPLRRARPARVRGLDRGAQVRRARGAVQRRDRRAARRALHRGRLRPGAQELLGQERTGRRGLRDLLLRQGQLRDHRSRGRRARNDHPRQG